MMQRILKTAAAVTGFVVLVSSGALAQDAENGNQLFQAKGCWTCHGTMGQGGRGPKIAPGPLAFEAFAAYVRQPALEMPPFREPILSDAELQDIHAYLLSIPQPPDPADTIVGQ
jgi:ubiquinol-cytochrome c reductase cytochrome c subunit